MTLYHSTPRVNRESILTQGLLARDTTKHNYPGLWMEGTPNRGVLAVYASPNPGFWGTASPYTDVWKIDATGLPFDTDPVIHSSGTVPPESARSVRILVSIPPQRLSLVGEATT